jgi:hypothetical protein
MGMGIAMRAALRQLGLWEVYQIRRFDANNFCAAQSPSLRYVICAVARIIPFPLVSLLATDCDRTRLLRGGTHRHHLNGSTSRNDWLLCGSLTAGIDTE